MLIKKKVHKLYLIEGKFYFILFVLLPRHSKALNVKAGQFLHIWLQAEMVEIRSLHSLLLMFGRTKRGGKFGNIRFFLCQQTDKINAYYNCYLIWIYLFLTHISDIASLYVFTHVMYILHINNIFALMGVLVAYNKVDYTQTLI